MSHLTRGDKTRLLLVLAWVTFATSAYFLQIRIAPPPGSELYAGGLRHSSRLFAAYLADRILPACAALLVMCAAALLGRRLLSLYRVSFRSYLQHVLYSTALGLGSLGAIASLLGLAHWLRRDVMIAILALIFIVERRALVRGIQHVARFRPQFSGGRGELAAGVLLAGTIGINLLLAGLPPTYRDAVAHHFYITREFLEAEGFFRLYWVPYSDGVVFHDMIFAPAFLMGGATAAKVLNALAGLWVAGYVYDLARRRFAPDRAVLAASLAYVSPLVLKLSANGLTDFFLAMFCLTAIDAFLEWQDRPRLGWMALAGTLLGFALGVKLSASLVLILLVIGVLATSSVAWRLRGRHCLVFAVTALIVWAPWCARSYLYTGNPIYPVLPAVFGESDNVGYARYVSDLAVSSYGSEDSPGEYLALPWRIFMRQSHRSVAGGYGGGVLLTPLFLLVLPCLVFLPPRRRDERAVLLLSLGFLALWAVLLPHTLRYAFPVVPLWAALCAGVLARLAAVSPSAGRATVSLCLALLVFPSMWTCGWGRARDVFHALRPDKDREYLVRALPSLPVLESMNGSLPAETPVFTFNLDRYYCHARCYAGWSDRTGRRALSAADAEDAAVALKEIGVQGILFSDRDQQEGRFVLFEPPSLDRFFRHVKSENDWHFYVWASKKSKSGRKE